jgi:RimJ/RimL family protein N-acetyltransferase
MADLRMAHPFWPLFDLVVRTPRLELRSPTDEMCVELAQVASPTMFPGGESYFKLDWLSEPSPMRERHSLQYWWRNRATFTPEDWRLEMAVVIDGQPVGSQGIYAQNFPLCRSVETGSWLCASHQGRGLGKEMRSAILHLAFVGLGAMEAHSGAFEGNEASIGVSRSVGYEDNGRQISLRASRTPTGHLNFRMSRERFEERRRHDIVIENLGPCLELFGLSPDLAPLANPQPSPTSAP